MQTLSLLYSCSRTYKRRLLYSRSDYIEDGEDKEFLKLMNMYTPTQIEAIEIFWRKDLSFGCIVCADKWVTQKLPLIWTSCIIWVTSDEWEIDTIDTYLKPYKDHEWSNYNDSLEWFMSTYTILWHTPTLEDIFKIAEKKDMQYMIDSEKIIFFYDEEGSDISSFSYNPTIQVLEQPEETLKRLISLFK